MSLYLIHIKTLSSVAVGKKSFKWIIDWCTLCFFSFKWQKLPSGTFNKTLLVWNEKCIDLCFNDALVLSLFNDCKKTRGTLVTCIQAVAPLHFRRSNISLCVSRSESSNTMKTEEGRSVCSRQDRSISVKLVHRLQLNVSDTHHMSGGLATWQELLGREGREGHLSRLNARMEPKTGVTRHQAVLSNLDIWLWQWKTLISPMMESPPLPLPTLYCISQASPIMGFTLRQVTRGGGPAPLLTMAPWGPKRLRCCTVSMPPPPATPPSSTYTARINLRTQVCICASVSSTFWTFQFDSWHCFMRMI